MKLKINRNDSWLVKYGPQIERSFASYTKSFPANSYVSVHVISSNEISRLNKKYRQVDSVTDVLSFPLIIDKVFEDGEQSELGEIYVCEEYIKKNVDILDLDLYLVEAVIHGCLHLLGFEHHGTLEKPEIGDEKMFSMQKEFLKKIVKNTKK